MRIPKLLSFALLQSPTSLAFVPLRSGTFIRRRQRAQQLVLIDPFMHQMPDVSTFLQTNLAVPKTNQFIEELKDQIMTKILFPRIKPKESVASVCALLVMLPIILGVEQDSSRDSVSSIGSMLTEFAMQAGQNAGFKTEVLNDLSHVALDFVTLTRKVPAPAAFVRLLAVVGRLFVLAADYLPDQHIDPEELVFQVVMLHLAWSSLLKSVVPFVVGAMASSSKKMKLRDGRVYSLLFEPLGLDWKQFKALSGYSMDWITLGNGKAVEITLRDGKSDSIQYMYWLYDGSMTVREYHSKDIASKYVVSRSPSMKDAAGKGLLGDLAMLSYLDEAGPKKKKTHTKCKGNSPHEKAKHGSSKIRATAGDKGATLLRIDASHLLRWIQEHDETLEQPIRSLLLRGIREKLSLLGQEEVK